MLIAVPSEAPGGLDAPISAHFGHCHAFTMVNIDGEEIGEVTVLENEGHDHGGCMAPVRLLQSRQVEALVAGGLGGRPLAGFQQVGIRVYFKEEARSVRDAVQLVIDGKCREFEPAQTCGGGEGGCGGDHAHEPVEREPIEGPADVRDGRVVSLHYKLKDSDGELIESSGDDGPMQYLHGHGNIVPGLEKALGGLEAGAQQVVEVAAAEAYGERDESKIFEVPRVQLPDHAEVGGVLRARQPDGSPLFLTVVALDDKSARLDPNHPLAGKDLVFDVTIVSVESATPDESARGQVAQGCG